MKRSDRADERMMWLLRRVADFRHVGFVCCWDEADVDAFVEAFPEAGKTLKVYTLGANVSPMLNRAARRAYDRGFLSPGSVGTWDARSFNQRTWARTWNITDKGRAAIATAPGDTPL